ncbi:hypothetical protein ACWCOZ_16305 [Streptomyces sp. NPDC001840]
MRTSTWPAPASIRRPPLLQIQKGAEPQERQGEAPWQSLVARLEEVVREVSAWAARGAYSNGPCREYLRHRGLPHTIAEKTDSQAARLRKGSRGGRPPGFDEERHKKRNTVERAINRLRQHRAVAARYDKRRYPPRHRHSRGTDDPAPLVSARISP